ncbi:MAG TPA: hypothetical protein IAA55_04530 [Candidatus Pullilachnospira gallistercoris]|uniref:Uncharacterized protein n=1 Tax=Candidatus Pullilachnospira gallistercoris TaxID=2840911 RepID=A0A9D1E959_9FIRM|nr:hypothetical protein [Candidatus Pullilachnospira gallistercoris]
MFAAALIFMLIGFLMLIVGGFVSLAHVTWGMLLMIAGLLMIAAAAFLMWKKAAGAFWKCEKCGSLKLLSWKEDLTGQTVGYLEKEIYCDKCGKKTRHTLVRRKER